MRAKHPGTALGIVMLAAAFPIPAGALSYLPNGMPYGGYRDLYLIDSVGLSHYTGIARFWCARPRFAVSSR